MKFKFIDVIIWCILLMYLFVLVSIGAVIVTIVVYVIPKLLGYFLC